MQSFFNTELLIHSFKTLIACLIGILLTKFITFRSDQWVVITIIVVMCSQIYVGSVLQKSWLRFAGTLVGCLFAILGLVTVGDSPLAVAITVGLSSFIFSYLGTGNENLSYAGTLGAVTTAIIMLGQTPTVTFAAERFLEISVGILIATLVSQFILPIHARTHLRKAQIKTLEKMRDYYQLSIMTAHDPDNDFYALDEDIVKSLLRQRQLANESRREPLAEGFDQAKFLQTINDEKEILRAMIFMQVALSKIRYATPAFINEPAFIHFNQSIIMAFNTIITALGADKSTVSYLPPATEGLAADVQQYIRSSAQLHYLEGMLFCAERLANGLGKLAKNKGILTQTAPDSTS
jgi:uncharacterized membrane protein YccC